jgi:hypothetical protein
MADRLPTRLALALAVVAAVAVVAASLPVTDGAADPPTSNVTAGGEPNESAVEAPPLGWAARGLTVLVALALTAGVGGMVVRWSLRDADLDQDPPAPDDDGPTADPDLDAVADAAGRAARRIERADPDAFDNEVYHAWRAMTVALAADGDRTRTPEEFRELAVDAGMDPGDVHELTDLFRRVRYGDAEPTPELEERATDLLWRIDREYGDR